VVEVALLGPQRRGIVAGLLWRAVTLWRTGQFAAGIVSWEAAARRWPGMPGMADARWALRACDFLRAADVAEYVALAKLLEAPASRPRPRLRAV